MMRRAQHVKLELSVGRGGELFHVNLEIFYQRTIQFMEC